MHHFIHYMITRERTLYISYYAQCGWDIHAYSHKDCLGTFIFLSNIWLQKNLKGRKYS